MTCCGKTMQRDGSQYVCTKCGASFDTNVNGSSQ